MDAGEKAGVLMHNYRRGAGVALGRLSGALLLSVLVIACGGDGRSDSTPAASSGPSPAGGATRPSGEITVYSGRAEALVAALIAQFERDTGIKAKVRYGGSAELAATLQEEGNASPADVFWSQDPGPLGALSGRFASLPNDVLNQVDAGLKSEDGKWVGVSGRVRVVVYNPDKVQPAQIPNSILGMADPGWKGRVGWAPTNGSFQIMVTALRVMKGEDVARKWLADMKANETKPYGNNNAVLQAVAAGEVDAGLINHYYLHAARRTTPNIKAANHYLNNPDDPGALIMVSGVGMLSTTRNKPAAELFVSYLLSHTAQQYFATETAEYPISDEVIAPVGLQPFDQLRGPRIDFARLADLQGTLALLRQTGVVQ
jgi:iron(III) transport system substrate-binding protein